MIEKKTSKSSTPAWMVTFADMMALLLTFFILMLSMSSTDVGQYEIASMSLMEAFGGGGRSIIVERGMGADVVGEPGHKGQAVELMQVYVDKTLEEELKKGLLEVEWNQGSLMIRFPERVTFPTASSDLHASFSTVVRKVAKALVRTKGKIIVAGHTDNVPIHNERFRSNWELSTARAVSVVHALLDSGQGLKPERFIAQGYSDTQPLVPNDSKADRARNRRVELSVVSEKSSPAKIRSIGSSISLPDLPAGPTPAGSAKP